MTGSTTEDEHPRLGMFYALLSDHVRGLLVMLLG